MVKTQRQINFLLLMVLATLPFLLQCGNRYYIIQKTPGKKIDLNGIHIFAIIYKHVPLSQLGPFELIIVEGDAFSKEEIMALRARGKIVLAYLNISEIEVYRKELNGVKESWIIGPNPTWPEHLFVNPGKRGWRQMLEKKRIRPLIARGVQGFLLDSVDLASQGRHPELRAEMVQMIHWLRNILPDATLIANNAIFILDEIADEIDGVLIEEAFNTFDADGNYAKRNDHERFRNLQTILEAKKRWSLPFFLVDYCPRSWLSECRNIDNICSANGLPHFCTDRYASTIYTEFYENENSKQKQR